MSEPRSVQPVLVDAFGRLATDLRISLTDRCSLRCTYCMPAEGLVWLGKSERLDDDEIVHLARVFIGLGVASIRLTGGEPLVHPTLVSVVARLAALEPRPELSLTTNGISLDRRAGELVAAGLDRINVSVDTLDRARFAQLTRRDRLDDVLAGVAAAAAAGLSPVKINAVLVRDSNVDEAPELLNWALCEGYHLRFIEHMPLDA
ncbi:MAG: 3,8-cyclase, partial [Pseudonocardiales bacterium]|nr:3,8-cyclase [Pseudonocardiales bacterium]